MSTAVKFKGSREGLQLIINQSADFPFILYQLKNKLEQAARFFKNGATVSVPANISHLTEVQRYELSSLLSQYGLCWTDYEKNCIEEETKGTKYLHSMPVELQHETAETLVVPRTLRSGQKIVHDGSVVVEGDLNPGAEVIAGGNVTVLGTCRGMAHAGANGSKEATITAKRLIASQLRIADIIARSPERIVPSDYVETARIVDNTIVIEPESMGGEQN